MGATNWQVQSVCAWFENNLIVSKTSNVATSKHCKHFHYVLECVDAVLH